MSQLQPLLDSLYQGNALTREQSAQLFSAIVEGEMDPVAMAGMLVALKMRGETIEEITGAADALRQAAKPFPRSAKSLATGVVDIVGDQSIGKRKFVNKQNTIGKLVYQGCTVVVHNK